MPITRAAMEETKGFTNADTVPMNGLIKRNGSVSPHPFVAFCTSFNHFSLVIAAPS